METVVVATDVVAVVVATDVVAATVVGVVAGVVVVGIVVVAGVVVVVVVVVSVVVGPLVVVEVVVVVVSEKAGVAATASTSAAVTPTIDPNRDIRSNPYRYEHKRLNRGRPPAGKASHASPSGPVLR
jgi:hypothetical protein